MKCKFNERDDLALSVWRSEFIRKRVGIHALAFVEGLISEKIVECKNPKLIYEAYEAFEGGVWNDKSKNR